MLLIFLFGFSNRSLKIRLIILPLLVLGKELKKNIFFGNAYDPKFLYNSSLIFFSILIKFFEFIDEKMTIL